MSMRIPKHPLDWFIAGLVLLTLAATGFAAYYTRAQWRTAQDSEQRQLRAYVAMSDIWLEAMGKPTLAN